MTIAPQQVICVDRKMINDNVKARLMAFIGRMAESTGGATMSWEEAQHLSNPVIIRGLTFHTAIKSMMASQRNFFYIDNGYFGNHYTKMWFRIIENHVHDVRDIIARDRSRLERCAITVLPRKQGRKILLAPPSIKSFSIWNIYQDQWIAETVAAIKQHTDRPIVIREKRPRWERFAEDTIEQALDDDVHCLVTYNSVAAVEAIMRGVPAICLGPNAAAVVSSTDLREIECPKFPDDDLRDAWLRHLSYSQFSFIEMSDGSAWRILRGS
jgi:hypothetical protein